MQVFTIGHSNHTPQYFLSLLNRANIEVLVDVRSNPNSRWAPFTTEANLREILRVVKVRYIYMGDILGGHPSEPDSYDEQTGEVDYRKIQSKDSFRLGISRILVGLKRYRVCLMCAEEDPTSCHRNLLVSASLRQAGVTVQHIRGDGRVQTDDELWKERIGVPVSQYQLPL